MVETYLQHFFGDRVTVRYLEMAEPEQKAQVEDLLAKIPRGYLFYPLVFIDDSLELVGSAEYHEVLYAVQQYLQGGSVEDTAESAAAAQ